MPPSSLVGGISETNTPSPATQASTSAPAVGIANAVAGPSSIPISPEVLAARQNASEEEDDETDWQIREGNGPLPAWAKRKASTEEEEEGQGPTKRQRQALS